MVETSLLDAWMLSVYEATNKVDTKARIPALLESFPASSAADAPLALLLIRAVLNLQFGKAEETIVVWNQFLREHPESRCFGRFWAIACFRAHRYDLFMDRLMEDLLAGKIVYLDLVGSALRLISRGEADTLSAFYEKYEKAGLPRINRYDIDRWICTGLVLEREGKTSEALGYYRRAMLLIEGCGLPYCFYFSCQLNAAGVPLVAPRASRRDIGHLVYEVLGYEGRFGDTVSQYIVLKWLERQLGLELHLPLWFGRRFFTGASEPMVCEVADHSVHDIGTQAPDDRPITAFGLKVEYLRELYHSAEFAAFVAENMAWVREVLKPCAEMCAIMGEMREKLRARGETVVATHVRLTDFKLICPDLITPFDSYRKWMAEHLGDYPNPVVFLATDDEKEARAALGHGNVVTLSDLGLSMKPGLEQLYDFAGLCAADVLVSSRSTFCRITPLFNANLRELWYSKAGDLPFERTETPVI